MQLNMKACFGGYRSQEPGEEGGGGAGAQEASETMLEAITEGLAQGESQSSEPEKASKYDRDEAGRFAKKGESQPTETDSAAKQAVEKAKAQPDLADELTMPEGLSVKAQERFQALTVKVKESQQQLQRVQSDLDGFREIMQDSRAQPQDIMTALNYIKAVNTGDLRSALTMLDEQRRQIAIALGQSLPGVDALVEFPDLKQRVEAYQMDEQAAIEIARARVSQRAMEQRTQSQAMQARQQHEAEQVRQQAIRAIDQMGAQWAKTDPDFAAKEEIIMKQIKTIAERFPPSMWANQVEILYQTLSSMQPPAPRQQQPSPLRPSGQSAGSRQPSSMLEALNIGLGYGA